MKASRFAQIAIWMLVICAALSVWAGKSISAYVVGLAVLAALKLRWQEERSE